MSSPKNPCRLNLGRIVDHPLLIIVCLILTWYSVPLAGIAALALVSLSGKVLERRARGALAIRELAGPHLLIRQVRFL